ncbi:hypothetical protein RFI_33208, partial [Reticulomyxa filosa]
NAPKHESQQDGKANDNADGNESEASSSTESSGSVSGTEISKESSASDNETAAAQPTLPTIVSETAATKPKEEKEASQVISLFYVHTTYHNHNCKHIMQQYTNFNHIMYAHIYICSVTNETSAKEVEPQKSKEANKESEQSKPKENENEKDKDKEKEDINGKSKSKNPNDLPQDEKKEQEICNALLTLLQKYNFKEFKVFNSDAYAYLPGSPEKIINTFSYKKVVQPRDVSMLLLGNIQRLLKHLNISSSMPPLPEVVHQSKKKMIDQIRQEEESKRKKKKPKER